MSEPSYMRFFPYGEPYPNQRAAMDRIADALGRGRDVMLEGAPGTGKTLAALAPALEHAREHDRTVVITTNVHQQMRQFAADARAITREEPLRAVVFKGKSSMCHIDVDYRECQTLREATRELVDAEADRADLERRQRALLSAAQEGDDDAAEAREAVVAELEEVAAEIESLRGANVCDRYYENLTRETDEFFAWLFVDVRTPEEIYAHADERGLCGYELLKEGVESVDLVVCNYRHLLDPAIREQFFRWLGRDPGEVVAVFDEAHNLERAARDHATRTLTENALEEALAELSEADDSRAAAARNVLEPFRDALVETYGDALGFGDRERIGEEWTDVPIANDDRRDDVTLAFLRRYEGRGIDAELELAVQLGRKLEEDYETAYRRGEASARSESATLAAAAFVRSWLDDAPDDGRYPLAGVRRHAGTGEVYGRVELYTCIPRQVTGELFGEVAASVLLSATLRPFDVTEAALGLEDPETLAYALAYPEENRRTYAVATPPLFSADRDDPTVQSVVADTLADVVRFTPGNSLLFFPSYAEAARYRGLLAERAPDADLLADEAGTPTEELRRSFVDSDAAALFTSLWGTLTEGVSFDGDAARTVAVVGVPYPRLSERLEAVQAAYDRAYGGPGADAGWRYAVEIPTIRKTRQAIGRVIRSPEEVGVRALLDERYTAADLGKYSVRGTFPPEEREELIDVEPGKLKYAMRNFYADHGAYGGDPPGP